MAVNFILVLFFSVNAVADSHIIIYAANPEHKPTELDSDSDNAIPQTQMTEVKAQLANISSNLNTLSKRVNSLELAGETTPSCPDGWLSYQVSCYLVGTEAVNFTTAKTLCAQQQAHLVHVETPAENSYLKSFLTANSTEVRKYWIGITDSESEGLWKLTDNGKTVPFTDWGPSEPQNNVHTDGITENCALFTGNYGYRWADVICHANIGRVLCEKNMT